MSGALAVFGWALAAALALRLVRLRRRLALVARAEHELRGPAAVLALVGERMGREPACRRHAAAIQAQLLRLGAGLADLTAARVGQAPGGAGAAVDLERLARSMLAGWAPHLRAATVDWRADPPEADGGRAARALGNLVANAAEHGDGAVELRGRPAAGGGVRVEVVNGTGPRRRADSGRGLGLAIARDAARRAGGEVSLEREDDRVVAALELPAPTDRAA